MARGYAKVGKIYVNGKKFENVLLEECSEGNLTTVRIFSIDDFNNLQLVGTIGKKDYVSTGCIKGEENEKLKLHFN